MSTTAVIRIKDRHDTFALYKHGDGTLTECKKWIERAKKYAWPVERWEAGDFAAAMVRVMKDSPGHVYLADPKEDCGADNFFLVCEENKEIIIKQVDS